VTGNPGPVETVVFLGTKDWRGEWGDRLRTRRRNAKVVSVRNSPVPLCYEAGRLVVQCPNRDAGKPGIVAPESKRPKGAMRRRKE